MSTTDGTPETGGATTKDGADDASLKPFRIRTVTAFVALTPSDFKERERDADDEGNKDDELRDGNLERKIGRCVEVLRTMECRLVAEGYEVQTVRIATNPFGEWLTETTTSSTDKIVVDAKLEKKTRDQIIKLATERLEIIDTLLSTHEIGFCSLGPSMRPDDTEDICPLIVSRKGGRLSCSANVEAEDVVAATAAAKCMRTIASFEGEDDPSLAGGLGNFRFGSASRVRSGVPFFPGAAGRSALLDRESPTVVGFALGLENGGFAKTLLTEAGGIDRIGSVFGGGMRKELLPLEQLCSSIAEKFEAIDNDVHQCEGENAKLPPSVRYIGIDTSLNPSLDDGGSVANAIEALSEVGEHFGGRGSLAAAAAITKSLQSIPDITLTGYCGLMLPVLEDNRLAELAAQSPPRLSLVHLLSISSVCGVGLDTVPVPGDATVEELASIVLDVAALAGRWNKPLSCRLFPAPNLKAGDETKFDSPYMCNSCVFDVG